MRAEIITIGDELLIGQIINTNQAYIAGKLNGIGVPVGQMTTVGDEMAEILNAFDTAWQRNEIVIVTGGLGPTHDDITKKAVCTFFKTDLISSNEARNRIEALLRSRNVPWSDVAEEQTMVPRSATVLPNPVGTASGMLFQESGKYFFVLPGVPYEMQRLLVDSVIPILAPLVKDSAIRHLTLRTAGITESRLAAQLGDIEQLLQGAKLAFLPSLTGVRLRITVHDRSTELADARVKEVEERIRARVAQHIYGAEEEELEDVLGRILTERNLTLAVAESCSGGLIADRITNVSGSSVYFERGVIAYSNESKTSLCGVPEELIAKHGAVSKEVAEAMAAGIRKIAGTDIGLSTTGIAGPTGGTLEKPIGLVWIGYSDAHETLAVKFALGDQRRLVKERAAQGALELVRRRILTS